MRNKNCYLEHKNYIGIKSTVLLRLEYRAPYKRYPGSILNGERIFKIFIFCCRYISIYTETAQN